MTDLCKLYTRKFRILQKLLPPQPPLPPISDHMTIELLPRKQNHLLVLLTCLLLAGPGWSQTVSSWVSNATASQKLAPQPTFSFAPDNGGGIIITIDPQTTYQTMDGFGAAMTGSSAYLFNNKLSATARGTLFDDLFTSGGIRLSMVRHTIGASDFNLTSYTYNDLPPGQTDATLSQFSIAYDQTDIIPMLQLARQKNGTLKIMG